MPTDTTVIEQIIDPIPEDVAELDSFEPDLVHIAGTETITGLKTFTQVVTAPSFVGAFGGTITGGVLASNFDLAGFAFLNAGGSGMELTANKGAANGYAPLNASSLVARAYLGTGGTGGGTKFLADDGTFKTIAPGPPDFGSQVANTIFAGPAVGADSDPTFRALVEDDIPALAESKITNLVSDLAGKVPTARTITAGVGLTGGGDLSANRTITMGTPSTLGASSANSVSGTTHSHAITASSAPGAAASLLKTDASGYLTLVRLSLTDQLFISASTSNLYMKDTSTGFRVSTTGIIKPQTSNIFRATTFSSGTAGWEIDDDGNAEFNNVRVRGELSASVFKISEISATAGTFGVFYSASTLYSDCTTPNLIGASFVFEAKNSDAGGILFAVGDVVRMKAWTGIEISDAWATITARVDHDAYATYTAIFEEGTAHENFLTGTAVVDYGPADSGFITLSADGTIGSTPNLSMATHVGDPWNTQTLLLRLGNLNGSYDKVTDVYGLGIGDFDSGEYMLITPSDGVQIFGAGGNVRLNADGLSFVSPVSKTITSSLNWYNSDEDLVQTIGGYYVFDGDTMVARESGLIIASQVPARTIDYSLIDISSYNSDLDHTTIVINQPSKDSVFGGLLGNVRIYGTSSKFAGVSIGNNTLPTEILDIYGRIKVRNSSAPSTPTGGPVIYAEAGALKCIGTSGTVVTLCAA